MAATPTVWPTIGFIPEAVVVPPPTTDPAYFKDLRTLLLKAKSGKSVYISAAAAKAAQGWLKDHP